MHSNSIKEIPLLQFPINRNSRGGNAVSYPVEDDMPKTPVFMSSPEVDQSLLSENFPMNITDKAKAKSTKSMTNAIPGGCADLEDKQSPQKLGDIAKFMTSEVLTTKRGVYKPQPQSPPPNIQQYSVEANNANVIAIIRQTHNQNNSSDDEGNNLEEIPTKRKEDEKRLNSDEISNEKKLIKRFKQSSDMKNITKNVKDENTMKIADRIEIDEKPSEGDICKYNNIRKEICFYCKKSEKVNMLCKYKDNNICRECGDDRIKEGEIEHVAEFSDYFNDTNFVDEVFVCNRLSHVKPLKYFMKNESKINKICCYCSLMKHFEHVIKKRKLMKNKDGDEASLQVMCITQVSS